MNYLRNKRQSKVYAIIASAAVGFAVIGLVGCATMEKSVTLGVVSGIGVGTSVGLASGATTETTLIAAGVGAAVGGLASYIIHDSLNKRDDQTRRDTLFNLDNHGIRKSNGTKTNPTDINGLLTSPEVEEDWVETHTDGNRLIEGHRVWSITDQSRWDLSRKLNQRKRK